MRVSATGPAASFHIKAPRRQDQIRPVGVGVLGRRELEAEDLNQRPHRHPLLVSYALPAGVAVGRQDRVQGDVFRVLGHGRMIVGSSPKRQPGCAPHVAVAP